MRSRRRRRFSLIFVVGVILCTGVDNVCVFIACATRIYMACFCFWCECRRLYIGAVILIRCVLVLCVFGAFLEYVCDLGVLGVLGCSGCSGFFACFYVFCVFGLGVYACMFMCLVGRLQQQ